MCINNTKKKSEKYPLKKVLFDLLSDENRL